MCDFTAHMCTGMILSNYKLFVNPLFKLISIEHVIIGSRTLFKYDNIVCIIQVHKGRPERRFGEHDEQGLPDEGTQVGYGCSRSSKVERSPDAPSQ